MDIGRQRRIEPYDPRWTPSGPNILAEANLRIADEVLRQGWICGVHLHFAGGTSGDTVVFGEYAAYLKYVNAATPGDLFVLWSVPEMRRRDLLLVDARYREAEPLTTSLLSPDGLRDVCEYLAEGTGREVFAVAPCGTTDLKAALTDLDGSEWDRFLVLAQQANVLGGELCVLPFTSVDRPELYLLKAKRPNERGEVPVGGAY
jgi:hypothetical protein